MNQDIKLDKEIKKLLAPYKTHVKRRAQGALIYDYLVPSGVYEEQWDWDAFFMGMALASELQSEAIYLRNVVLNLIHNARADGFTPGCITPKGRDERLHQMKPFIAQSAYFAAINIRDFHWIKDIYDRLVTIATYREKHLWNKKYDLGAWFNSMESGADDNLAALEFPNSSVVAVDLNSYMYREFLALLEIAKKIGKKLDAQYFHNRAKVIKNNINKHLWSDIDKSYFNLDSRNGLHIKRHSFSNFTALWANLAEAAKGKEMIKRYLTNPQKMWSKYGIRTLAADDSGYNNVNKLKPHSNWQGPVWPIANYIYIHALLNYGFQKQAIEVAQKIARLVIDDIEKNGMMHENYDAETGKPLAAPNFVSWNLLVANMLDEAMDKRNPFEIV